MVSVMYQPLENGQQKSLNAAFVKTHIYKLIGIFVIFLIFVQYVSDFVITSDKLSESSMPLSFTSLKWSSNSSTIDNTVHFSHHERSLSSAQLFTNQTPSASIEKNHSSFLASLAHISKNMSSLQRSYSVPIAQQRNYIVAHQSSQYPVEICPVVPPKLVGPLKVLREVLDWPELEEKFPKIEAGGCFHNKACKPRQKVALIIPYRDREDQLKIFLHNIHYMLQRQQIDYCIYVVEQIKNTSFNRAKLFNIGFQEALNRDSYDCFVFHDVDLIPEDDRNLYRCSEQPRHMSVAIDVMHYMLPYESLFGGVSALSRDQMKILNGFSNEYWGWGGEDDDMSRRITFHGYQIYRPPAKYARYTMLKHAKEMPNRERYNKLYSAEKRFSRDGLHNLKYSRQNLKLYKLYSWLLIDPLQPPKKSSWFG